MQLTRTATATVAATVTHDHARQLNADAEPGRDTVDRIIAEAVHAGWTVHVGDPLDRDMWLTAQRGDDIWDVDFRLSETGYWRFRRIKERPDYGTGMIYRRVSDAVEVLADDDGHGADRPVLSDMIDAGSVSVAPGRFGGTYYAPDHAQESP